jgi:dTDP-4-dehydrorhamnose reductase
MRIVVTGKTGQVARSLIERAALHEGVEVVSVGRPELDLLAAASIERTIIAAQPDIVVSAAAYTAVDRAEDEPELAHAVNAAGAGRVAVAAAKVGAPVIHLSTDYVFGGAGEELHGEDGATCPLGVYGQSKLDGERAVMAANPRNVILRTAWLYSPAPHVRVNAIAPGAVLLPESYTEEERRRSKESSLLGTLGSPDDVVRTVLFLERSPFITGEVIVVDGGRLAR